MWLYFLALLTVIAMYEIAPILWTLITVEYTDDLVLKYQGPVSI